MNRAALEGLRGRWNRVRQEWRTGDGILVLQQAHGFLDVLDAILSPEEDAMPGEGFRQLWDPDCACYFCGRACEPGEIVARVPINATQVGYRCSTCCSPDRNWSA